ncbi:CENP-B N-terminal DNA-binding domain [Popillia japonica]|uniref:CENP-B N-terminal DNA-binding domain n=1 Tax=Popillia japonica TaxID=7064 RepID=A0AAW1JY21_POPJA
MSDVENDRRKRKKTGTWDLTNMRKAVEKVINNEMTTRQAANRYQVPRTTLNDRISAIKRGKEMSTEPLMGRFHNTFSLEHEKILVEHVKDLGNRLMPLNRKEFLYFVFQLGEKLKLPHQFNKEKKICRKELLFFILL